MCAAAPVILAAATTATAIGSDIIGYQAQSKQASANKTAAQTALAQTIAQTTARESQEEDATQQNILAVTRQAQSATAMARVGAAANGVTGNSVDAVLNDIQRDRGNFDALSMKNLGMTLDQLQMEKQGAQSTEQSRINSIQPPNPFALGLQITQAGVSLGNTIVRQTPAAPPKPSSGGGKP